MKLEMANRAGDRIWFVDTVSLEREWYYLCSKVVSLRLLRIIIIYYQQESGLQSAIRQEERQIPSMKKSNALQFLISLPPCEHTVIHCMPFYIQILKKRKKKLETNKFTHRASLGQCE